MLVGLVCLAVAVLAVVAPATLAWRRPRWVLAGAAVVVGGGVLLATVRRRREHATRPHEGTLGGLAAAEGFLAHVLTPEAAVQIDLHVHDADVLTLDGEGTGTRAGARDPPGSGARGARGRRTPGRPHRPAQRGVRRGHRRAGPRRRAQPHGVVGQTLAEIDLSVLRTLDEVYDAVAARPPSSPPGAFVTGAGYDDVVLGGSPHHAALDRAAGGRPVRLQHRSGHVCAGSTEALRRAGILDAAGRRGPVAVPEGGRVVLDDDGVPTGVVEEAAQPLLADLLRPFAVDDVAAALARASQVYAAQGLTHVTECGIAGGFIGRAPRARRLPGGPGPGGAAPAGRRHARGRGAARAARPGRRRDRPRRADRARRRPPPPRPHEDFLDGALSSRTAAMSEPFRDRDHAGYYQDDPAHMHDMVVGAHLAGWTVAAHAIGDRAVAAALDAFADAQARLPRPEVRHRVEHAGVVSDAEVVRFAALGVTPVPQARFLHEIGDSMLAAVGEERADLLYRHASFLRARGAGPRVVGPAVRRGRAPAAHDAGDGAAAHVVGSHDRSPTSAWTR